jgi:hypothetical protein
MLKYLETATFWQIFDDVAGAIFLFAMIFVLPNFLPLMKVIFE